MTDWAQELCTFYGSVNSDDTDELTIVDVGAVEPKPLQPTIRVPQTSPLVLGLVVLLVVGLGAGVALVVGGVKGAPEPVVATEPAFACEQEPLADRTTPDGVVVAFQHAYAANDAQAIEAVISKNSPLNDVDWDEETVEALPQVCVEILDHSPSNVHAETSFYDEATHQKMIYTQQFHLELSDIGPRILTITDIDRKENDGGLYSPDRPRR